MQELKSPDSWNSFKKPLFFMIIIKNIFGYDFNNFWNEVQYCLCLGSEIDIVIDFMKEFTKLFVKRWYYIIIIISTLATIDCCYSIVRWIYFKYDINNWLVTTNDISNKRQYYETLYSMPRDTEKNRFVTPSMIYSCEYRNYI